MKGYRNIIAVLLPGLLTGCTSNITKTEVWKPLPLVQWEDISMNPIIPVRQGYQIQIPLPTRGVFPLSMGVTRVALREGDILAPPGSTPRELVADPRNEFLQWNRSLDDLLAVSDVFPVSQRDLGGGPIHPQQIMASFRALNAGMGLVYAVNELSRHQLEMFGVLYDTKQQRPIASIHTQTESNEDLLEAEKVDKPVDLWKHDARAKVREQFEQLLHACVHELIHQDELEMTAVPDGRTTDLPVRLVEWPPHHVRLEP